MNEAFVQFSQRNDKFRQTLISKEKFNFLLQIPILTFKYKGSPTSTVSTSTISTSTNFRAIGMKLVLVEFLPDCYVVKLVLVEIGYVIPTSMNFA